MYNPVSTYRVQFNKDYTFSKFGEDLSYFFLLGAGSVYASPVFEATPGSMHGYDVTNPLSINHEIGTYEQFVELSRELKHEKTGWVQDIVPNHMAFHMKNQWLADVLENGEKSKYSDFFDIDFLHAGLNGKILLPFLGKELNEALIDREISVDWFNGSFVFRYFDYYFPFRFETFEQIIARHLADAPDAFHAIWYDMALEIKDDFLENNWPVLKDKLEKLYNRLSSFKKFINSIKEKISGDIILIEDLLNQQHYQLSSWRESSKMINYRRFFTVNSLIGLRMENDRVFESYHAFIEQQVKGRRFQGLRIDHVDGLKDPLWYLEKLRSVAGDTTYIVTEKILEKEEELIHGQPVQGTSGYDYMAIVNNLLTFKKNMLPLDRYYRRLTGTKKNVEEIIYDSKRNILYKQMNGELDNLASMFDKAGFLEYTGAITHETIKESIGEFLVLFPVYKVYSSTFPLAAEDEKIIRQVFDKARIKAPALSASLAFLEDLFLNGQDLVAGIREKAAGFFLRCMQFTGPLMAKGVEDTVMYSYNSFIAHNEVGDLPGSRGITTGEYHEKMLQRQRYWPLTMNATSTHDTKRGEDVRARLNVISGMADEWMENVTKWMKLNKGLKKGAGEKPAPDANEEYFIYQTLAGVYPFDGKTDESFLQRMDEYLVKALREAKLNTCWDNPDENYENAVTWFTREILSEGSKFLRLFIPFQRKISQYGIINSITQLLLKATSPGIPDFYQGTELWDLSMVDPDNRRPVDYEKRHRLLKEILEKYDENAERTISELYSKREDGRIKLWLTHRLMKIRKSDPDLFLHGKYIPLEVKGKYRDHVIAFARNHENRWCITIGPLHVSLLNEKEPGRFDWEDTVVILPVYAPPRWTSSSSVKELTVDEEIQLSDIMEFLFPVFLQGNTEPAERAAGMLVHISSLPGKYGTGDLGDEAYNFADLLNDSGQSYWQILPFNPIDKGYGYSPYSSASAFAGNLMFLSPDLLVTNRLLHAKDLKKFRESDKTDFRKAAEYRAAILNKAFSVFSNSRRPLLIKNFNDYREQEKNWLDDYALFVCLKREFRGAPWIKWPERIRNRDEAALNEARKRYSRESEIEKFGQYLFYDQWSALKSYCNAKGIRLIGDMSFYINYDSADVWAGPQYFKLDDKKNPLFVAGVPPDYFSRTGQLWNMPVYSWDTMKNDGFDWWMRRIKRNLDFCDIIRFDHFRGFSAFWEVPAGEKTAEKGEWTDGPGNEFFEKVKLEYPEMPFIAEDLGLIDDKVHKLRISFTLPGMVVLQFAFGDNTPHSAYIPHNHKYNSIVYTGTHDNNTIRGWFTDELRAKNRKEAEEYAGHEISKESCHQEFIRVAYGSVAKIAIIPVQDILGLGGEARFNQPSTARNNWSWKLRSGDIDNIDTDKLRRMAVLFGRF